MKGYNGKILRVNLSTGTTWGEPLNIPYARAYIGGSGLAARYLYDLVGSETDPLGPENPLIFMNGPLTGSKAPCPTNCTISTFNYDTGFTAGRGAKKGP